MCGIFAYSGTKSNASQIVLSGLKRLDYRGYDSWGVAVSNNQIHIQKDVGKIQDIDDLPDLPDSSVAIAHTRWATTGAVTKLNAHPHPSTDGSFALVQNGIVENYKALKENLLKKGYKFYSQTDTEVIVRLIEEEMKKTTDFKIAIREAFQKLQGRNTIMLITKSQDIYAARNGSPLVIGVGDDSNEFYLSSDSLSFAPYVKNMVVVENGELCHVSDKLEIFDIKSGREIKYKKEDINIMGDKIDKEGFSHFMLKEIFESPYVIDQLLKQDEKTYLDFAKVLKNARNVYTIGSGGAGVAASQVGYYLRKYGRINAVSLIGSDATEYVDLFSPKDVILTISQSGETADVLEVLELAKKKGTKIASFINMPGSMITRMSDYKFMSEAGPEICVMSTKTFISQIAFGYLLSKTIAGINNEAKNELNELSKTIKIYLNDQNNHNKIKKLAQILSKKEHIFLLGKGQNSHITREGMVKIIEAAYIHAHALPAGDLKHYVITLMEKGVPIIAVVSNDSSKTDMLNAIDQVRARGAEVFAIANRKHENFDHFILVSDTKDTSAIMNLIPLQLLSYYMAVTLGNNVDKPRNIAKSVTVK